ncbi:sugar nucleotide-binding protein [Altibacter sp.]|uniref:sugar nucleotide-binding protein n=1 Tax=Altibacter sp. TaxID=2024823 RepID=UPI000C9821F5|nr:sugar nucleotide-binding protein [Altibacter sp.]MAP55996.1 dTDP-4-dehydrorhamnose reductase [Altibacter sp.]|tara:strand:- start:152 stop:1009 length:858 start_codon:yes stop_codon:yes gene_type:complete
MKQIPQNRILIIGASGFIGHALYKELQSYFDVYGTYCRDNEDLKDNKVFYRFDVTKHTILEVLAEVRPCVIISSIKGDFASQRTMHQTLANYVLTNEGTRLLFLSSAAVFDGKFTYPSYEKDLPIAESDYGKHKLSIEKIIRELPIETYAILRLPTVLGVNSPAIFQLKQTIKHHASFEVFPNLIITVTTANKIAQQIHYIINQRRTGIFHLASNDMVHHEDLFRELTDKLSNKLPIFKRVFSRNEESYLAILPKENILPKQYRITVAEVIEDSTLKEEISTLKY